MNVNNVNIARHRKPIAVHVADPQPDWAVYGAKCLFEGVEHTIIAIDHRGAMIANSIGRIHGWVAFREIQNGQ